MGIEKTYTDNLMPRKIDIKRTFYDFEELKEIIKKGHCDKGGFCFLNDNKMFADAELPDFFNFKIQHPHTKIILGSLKVELKKIYEPHHKDIYWTNHQNRPKNAYGIDKLRANKSVHHFERGHLIADSLIKYTETFNCHKWQDFVMLTEWCNRANTNKRENIACGMFYFEQIILDSLEADIDITYRVTPVFKKVGELDEVQEYECLPRGIIIEAKTMNGDPFEGENDKKFVHKFTNEFNVFIPNAQKNVVINYETGKVKI